MCDLDEMVWLQATGEVVDSQLHANAAAHVALASAPFGGGDRSAVVYTACGSEKCEWLSAKWPMMCSGEQADAEGARSCFVHMPALVCVEPRVDTLYGRYVYMSEG